MSYRVVFSPESSEQLVTLYHYLAVTASPDTATRYTDGIIAFCESLQTFPHHGTQRDDICSGLRITNYKKRTVIAFDVDSDVELVSIIYWHLLRRSGLRNFSAKRFRI
ncbi:type II toxin-antitoxin system RelE/ParE family toxin [Photorhabdus luminescens]|uniref:type II toxin-antitoxin system RelE/ParE family toxin n=1 Tax=Photorhabdus luminescens TaxID=29488 RepID=UPI0030DCEBD0